jgi:hypothetical protein
VALAPEDIKVIVAAIVVMAGSNAGSILNATSDSARHDPFTGRDAVALESHLREEARRERFILKSEILSQIHQEAYVSEKDCEKEKQAIRDRIFVLEQNQKHCMAQLERAGFKMK